MANILLVDDNPGLLELQAEFLRSAGHNVVTASDGMVALNKFREGNFDVVVTDLVMPEKEGIEVILELQKSQATTKIIAVSGGGRGNAQNYLTMAKQLGAFATLAKPFTGAELLRTVEQALQG